MIPALCVAEVACLLGKRHGPRIEAAFVRGLAQFDVIAPERDDWGRVADLVERYADLPLGATDAFVATVAERVGTSDILTLDRRHFGVLRTTTGASFNLLPA